MIWHRIASGSTPIGVRQPARSLKSPSEMARLLRRERRQIALAASMSAWRASAVERVAPSSTLRQVSTASRWRGAAVQRPHCHQAFRGLTRAVNTPVTADAAKFQRDWLVEGFFVHHRAQTRVTRLGCRPVRSQDIAQARRWRTALQDRIRIKSVEILSDDWAKLPRRHSTTGETMGNGKRRSEQTYDRGNGAAILPFDRQRSTVLLVRQFRTRPS